MTDVSQLQLWRLISPMLPIGAYAYSSGLEYAIDSGWVSDEHETFNWIHGVLQQTLTHTDLPVLARCYRGWQENDQHKVEHWNRMLLAMRESRELLLEDLQLGGALVKILIEADVTHITRLQQQRCSYVTAFSLACVHWQIPIDAAARALAFTWCENQVSAAMKLVPLGQSAGQRILQQLLQPIAHAAQRGLQLADDEIGISMPALAIGSACHEMQYSRLFRS